MKISKGFTLIELVISMLVIAIAMLGFAALMAFSARTVHSGYTKSAGTNTVQSVVRILQNNRSAVVAAFANSSQNRITINKNNFAQVIPDNEQYRVVNDLLAQVFDSVANMPGVSQLKGANGQSENCSVLEMQLVKHQIVAGTELASYEVLVHFLYQPLITQQKSRDDVQINCPGNGSEAIESYCPFEPNDNADLNSLRITNNLVCDTLGTTL